MDLAGLRTAVDRITGLGMDAAAQTEWINAALDEIATDRVWPWLDATDSFSTVADTASYALPDGYQHTRSLTSSTGHTYHPVSIRTGDDWWDWNDGIDRGFAVEGSNLILYPTPGSVFTMTHRYTKNETDLSADSDEPLIPAEFHTAVVHLASAVAFERMGNLPAAANQRSIYDTRWRRKMLNRLSRAKGPKRIRIRPGGGI